MVTKPLGESFSAHNTMHSASAELNKNGKRVSTDLAMEDYDSDSSDNMVRIDHTPAQLRRKITRFIDNSGMKLCDFQKAIGVSSSSYRNFMQSTGNKGMGSNTMVSAMRFFQKREARGEKMPRASKKQKKNTDGSSENSKGSSGAGKKSGKGGSSNDDEQFDVSDIHLHGEDKDRVPIYDTCDEIRRKIKAHMAKDNVTQASFCRAMSAQMSDGKITASSLQGFRGQHGPHSGGKGKVFYAAYVFFEKLRIKQGKPKTKHRQRMEEAWANGFPREGNQNFLCHADERPYEDDLGRLQFA